MFYFLLLPSEMNAVKWPIVLSHCSSPTEILAKLAEVQALNPTEVISVSETMVYPRLAKATPGELARAVQDWNNCLAASHLDLPQVKLPASYAASYRRWKKLTAGRDYLLEDVVAYALRQTHRFDYLTFAWLLQTKDGLPNSERVMHGNNGFAKKSGRQPQRATPEFESEEL